MMRECIKGCWLFVVMFAVLKTGGKQYRVSPSSIIRVEKLKAEKGDSITLNDVKMICKEDGSVISDLSTLSSSFIEATVLEQIRDKKIIVFKKKRRHNYRRKMGHRQYLTVLKVNSISV